MIAQKRRTGWDQKDDCLIDSERICGSFMVRNIDKVGDREKED